MKWIYWASLLVLSIVLLIIYFINLVYLSSTNMFLFSKNSFVPLSLGLLIIIFISFIMWALTVLFLKSLIKDRPKDIFDDDF